MTHPETSRLDLLRPDEFGDLAQLHSLCFGGHTSVESLLRQRYGPAAGDVGAGGNGRPRSEVIIARSESGAPVAAQAITWIPASFGMETVSVGMMTLGMVHPEWRRRGLFREVVEDAARVGWEGGAAVQFTMPNDRSQPAFERFDGWESAGPRSTFLLALDPGKLVGQRVGLGGLGSALGRPLRMASRWSRKGGDGLIELVDLARHASSIDDLATRVGHSAGKLMLHRGAAFAQWRYVDNPSGAYRFHASERPGGGFDGLVITTTQPRFGTTLGFVVDILSDAPEDRQRQLVRRASRALWEQGATAAIAVGRMEGSRRALRRAGFYDLTSVYPRTFHTYFSRQPTRSGPLGADFDPKQHWYLSLADFDSV